MTSLAVVYATLGRPDVVRASVDRLASQTRPPDRLVISTVSAADVAGIDRSPMKPEILFGTKGLCAQRNRALVQLIRDVDLIVFFDDDFIPADDYLEQAVALFEARPELSGATGWVMRDGIKTTGISFEDALHRIAEEPVPARPLIAPINGGLYGCNMILRVSMIRGMWFDETLPLYGWLEDLDFSYRLRERGPLLWSQLLRGVHMGTKGGRTSGVKFGYSQIANPIYMLRKRSAPRRHVIELMLRNVASNLARSLAPEPYIDRLGRLRGNALALRDFVTRRLDPTRILQID